MTSRATFGSYATIGRPSFASMRSTTCGTYSVPPFASAAYAIAICSTVTSTSPCPIAAFVAKPIL